jgi:hypothetical protein
MLSSISLGQRGENGHRLDPSGDRPMRADSTGPVARRPISRRAMLRASCAGMLGFGAWASLGGILAPRARGGQLESDADDSFTLVWVTDTHIRGRVHRDHVRQANRWVIENRERLNIRLFVHTGDVTHNGTEAHFDLAREAYADLYASGIPVLMAIGNHDYDDELRTGEVRRAERWNRVFGLDKVREKPWFGEAYEPGRVENYFATFTLAGEEWLVFILEFGPRDGVLEWVKAVCSSHPGHRALIFTHSYMNEGGRADGGSSIADISVASPSRYAGTGEDVNDGESMWSKALRKCGNLHSVHSGHTRPADLGALPQFSGFRQTSIGAGGRPVQEEYHNFQWITYGMSPQYDTRGYMRLMKFNLAKQCVQVQTYSPVEDVFRVEAKHRFAYPIDAHAPA